MNTGDTEKLPNANKYTNEGYAYPYMLKHFLKGQVDE